MRLGHIAQVAALWWVLLPVNGVFCDFVDGAICSELEFVSVAAGDENAELAIDQDVFGFHSWISGASGEIDPGFLAICAGVEDASWVWGESVDAGRFG